MTVVADEIVKRRFVLIERQGAGFAHDRVQPSTVGRVCGGKLLGGLFIGAKLGGAGGGRHQDQCQHGGDEAP